MNECVVKAIDFDLFWKLSMLVLLSNAPNLPSLLKDYPKLVNETKQKIRDNVGVDADSGIAHSPSYADEKLLGYNLSRRLKVLLICLGLSAASVTSYALFKDVPALSASTTYKCAITYLTYLGLLPVLVSFAVAFSVLLHIIKIHDYSGKA
jgi:hypothetical protein